MMSKRERILELKRLGKSDREIMDAVGYRTLSGVRGVASRANRQTASVIVDDLYYPSARDINDNDEWAEYLKFATKRDRMLKFFFWPDMHIPDTNWQAVELARKIRKAVKPDVDFFLGDEHDLDTVSTHWARSENRKRVDAFHEIRYPWNAVTEVGKVYTCPNYFYSEEYANLKSADPKAILMAGYQEITEFQLELFNAA